VTDTLGAPLALALVRRMGARSAVVCDDSGRFRLTDVSPGRNVIEVRRLGYVPSQFTVNVPADSALRVVIQLNAVPVVLEPLQVTSEGRSRSLVEHGFYERMRVNTGATYITPEEFEALHPLHVTQVLQDRPGVKIGYKDRFAVPWDRTGSCILNVFVDGIEIKLYRQQGKRVSYDFGQRAAQPEEPPIDPIGIDGFVQPSVVKAIEIYPSGAQVPPEFRTFNSCGAIVIWTKVD
jgi:hypothetical protein